MIKNIWQDTPIINHTRTLLYSYRHWTGKSLLPDIHDDVLLSRALYFAPFIVVSHGRETDPIFNYANLAAQKLWKIDWNDFTAMPSRLSAEPIEEQRRNELLEEGKMRGITYLKEGIRVDKNGRKFFIRDVVLFNLLDADHTFLGQGAVYENWEYMN